jgi:parallel beta-helix repeat protein
MWNNYVLFDMIYWFDFELINDFIFGRFKKLIMIKFKSANPAQGAWKLPSLFKKAFLSRNNLNRLFMLSILVLFTYTVNATVYYVSNSGNDSNAGTSESLPWKTLTKVNSFTPKAGDQILFKRGDEWTGSITVKASGTSSSRITYGAYGTGNKPKIYGSEVITGWTLHSGNIYKTTFNTQINQLFIDDVRAKAARYPNMGYLPINTVNTTQSFTCNNLNSSINYTGAKWIARTSPYSLETFSVTSSSSKTLTLSGTPYPNLNLKTGFILVGKLEFLDSAGEWYYDSATKTVYVWTREGDSPAHHIVRGSVYNSGVAGSGYNYITIKDLELLHNKISGISSSGSYLNIDNNTISLTDAKGIYVSPGSSNTISNNTVNGANHIGIEGYSDKSTYSDNIINETSLFDEIGLSGIGAWYMGSGLYVEGNDNIIKYNRVTNSGYNGIQFHKRNVVEYNFVKNALLTKDDGGGIYTAAAGSYPNAPTAGSIIRYNIIDGVFGSLEGCNPYGVSQGHGIYLDENSGGVTVEYNTVTNISDAGIFLHNSFNETVRYNTSYNNGRQYHISTDLGGSNFNNNILYAKARNMENYAIQFLGSQLNGKVAFTENTYINHYNKSNFFKFNESKYYDFVGWKTATGQDANSTIDIAALATGETEELFYNDTKQTKTFNLGSSVYKDIYGNQVAQSVTLEPFTSKILIKTATVNTIDNTPPTITSFSIPSTSPSLVVPITTFIAVDNNGVLRYMLTESTTPPNANDAGWLANAPVSYTFTSDGTKTLYAWVKDVAGNISKSLSDDVTITLPDNNSKYLGNIMVSNLVSTTANRRAVPATFIENGMIESISIYHNGGTGNLLMGVYADQSGSPYSLLGVTTSTLISSTEGWQTVSLLSPVTVSSGQTIWLSWVFQNNPGIRYSNGTPSRAQSTESWSAGMPSSFGPSSFAEYNYSIYCTYSTGNTVIIQQDSSKPIINAFSIPTTSSSLQININSFTASDNIGVTGFLITENSTAPTADNTGWKTSAPTSYSFSTEGTKTLYAWTKDAAGNVSASKSAQVVITLPDVTKPVVSAFTVPTTSSSLIVPVSSFTATDNIAVTGYLITENSTVPTSDNTGWKTSAPTSYSFSTEGTKTLYAWTKDAAGNVSASKSAQVVITLPDVTKPVISAFTVPTTSSSLIVPVSSFTATDNVAVTGYLITENSTVPTSDNTGWKTSAPTSYSFSTEGTKTLYAWTKDAAGNVSASKSAQVVIALIDVTKPVIISFSIPDTAKSLVIPIISFEAVDDKEVAGYMLTETESCPLVGNSCWTASAPTTYTISSENLFVVQSSAMKTNGVGLKSGSQISNNNATETTKTIYAWTKDAAGNISNAEKGDILIIFPDVESPNITLFTIPATSASLTIDVINLNVTDNIAVTGILLTESPSAPTADNSGWKTSAPTSYSFSSEGSKTLYAWAKDAAGNVSASKSAQVVITLPDVTKPVVSAFTVPATSSSLIVPVSSFTATDNVAVTGYLITENSTVPTSDNTGWKTSAPTSYSFSTEGTKTLYAWTKDAAGNVSASKSAQMVIALLSNTANTQGITDVFPSVTTTQNRRAVPVTFTGDAKIESISIYHNGGTDNMLLGVYSDQSGSPASLLGVTLSTKLNTTEGWQTISLISPASVKSGQKVWLSWVFQTNPGIRYTEGAPARAQSDNLWSSGMPTDFGKSSFADYKYSVFCTYTIDSIITIQPDITKPIITSFSVPASSSSLIVPISSFNSTDNVGVTGFMLTETSSTPNANDAGWNSTAPSSYNFNSEGTKTLYAWAKDAAGNVSVGKSAQVAVVLPVEVEIPETNIPEEQLNTQSILLRKGWNIFSTYIEPINESMDSVMEMLQVNDNLSIVQDKVCNTYEKSPITQNWINNIGNLQNAEGYMIKVQSDCSLEVSGKQIQLPFNIQIKRGWNIISFPVDGSIDAMKVVQPLIDAGVLYKIQDERGYSIENWRNLGWRNSIGNFNAGEGYILQANKNGVLTINELSPKSGLNFVERSETSYFKVCYEGNGINHMNINLVELNETNLHVGDEIAAFDGEICVGAIKLTEFDLANNAVGMAVSASELNETIGFTEGNPIVLKVWTNENGQESIFQPEVIEGDMIFNKQASVFVTLNSQSTIASDMFDNLKIDMYPNPANSFVTIRFSALPAEGTKIKLLDVLGNEIRTQVVQNTQETFNIQDLPVGMYVLKTESYNNQRIQKLIKR